MRNKTITSKMTVKRVSPTMLRSYDNLGARTGVYYALLSRDGREMMYAARTSKSLRKFWAASMVRGTCLTFHAVAVVTEK